LASSKKRKILSNSHELSQPPALAILFALTTGALALLQNYEGFGSDLPNFYSLHFGDGLHQWPYSTSKHFANGETINPVEYPAITGLIMWLFSFFVKPAQFAWVDYFRLTASVQVLVFALTVYLIQKLANRKLAIIFAISPAVLYSLNRNWDIWAISTMLIALYLFHKGKETQSAIWLAISIAVKFFPLVALLPVGIFYLRNKRLKDGLCFLLITTFAWFAINLPFILINYKGWLYFYEFSYKREIGSASFFEVTNLAGFGLPSTKPVFYGLNLLALGLVALYLLRSKSVIGAAEGTFFTMFAFILFNKQYSMQYVIWLASLAVLTIFLLEKKYQTKILVFYGIWQAVELIFQYSFFQRILTGTYRGTATPASPEISDSFYAGVGLVRYALAIGFTLTLAYFLSKQRGNEISARSPKP
jgi:uncharacterized membrane protein